MISRDEAHRNVKEWIENIHTKDVSKIDSIGRWHYGKIELHRDIDKIYDGFKSRVCKNCKHFKPREIDYEETFISSACLELEIPSISEDFGCNKFEPKIKDS